ncbi:hypothetical protein [Amycolatopsis sp. YIM 10]|uniref:hypothetical protein n=1 Tax=Amycolatopsis sp. YIM 10 TaxID=2653857 RepID=UPI0012905C40|nr:hypothetical protein [Amycolatopsis sp. YIM 10]
MPDVPNPPRQPPADPPGRPRRIADLDPAMREHAEQLLARFAPLTDEQAERVRFLLAPAAEQIREHAPGALAIA